jgi:hypothetical protein
LAGPDHGGAQLRPARVIWRIERGVSETEDQPYSIVEALILIAEQVKS